MRSLCRYLAIFALPGLATVTACGSDVEPGPGEEKVQAGEAEDTARMIDLIKEISLERYPAGEIKRFNQSKSLGCFDATFSVADGLPQDLRQGLFAEPNTWRARLRFANAGCLSNCSMCRENRSGVNPASRISCSTATPRCSLPTPGTSGSL